MHLYYNFLRNACRHAHYPLNGCAPAKLAFLPAVLLFVCSTVLYVPVSQAQVPVRQWDRSFGSDSLDYLRTVITTMDGGYLLAGNSFSGMEADKSDSSRGSSDYWIVKLDSLHNKVWDKSLGGTDLDVLSAAVQTSDGGYVLAGYSSSLAGADKIDSSRGSADYWVVKVDRAGIKQWDKSFGGGAYDQLTAMIATADKGYVLAGYSTSSAGADKTEDSHGGSDYWIVKIGLNAILPSPLKINFQDKDTTPPDGWLTDYGLPYGEKTVSGQDSVYVYGWKSRSDGMPVDLSVGGPLPGNGRKRPLPADTLLATFMHMQGNDVKDFRGTPVESYWELAVGNGDYEVTVSVGDPIDYTQSDAESHTINIEGVSAIANFIPQGANGSIERFKQAAIQVTVTDGLLTLDADGGRNTKINYALIQPLSLAASPVSVPGTGIQQSLQTIAQTRIRAFPNPFTNRLIIETLQRGKVSVSIMDLMGKYYYRATYEPEADLLDIDLSDVPMKAGFYLIRLQAGGSRAVTGIIKK